MKIIPWFIVVFILTACTPAKNVVKKFSCDNAEKVTSVVSVEVANAFACVHVDAMKADSLSFIKVGLLKCGETGNLQVSGAICESIAYASVAVLAEYLVSVDGVAKYGCSAEVTKEKLDPIAKKACELIEASPE